MTVKTHSFYENEPVSSYLTIHNVYVYELGMALDAQSMVRVDEEVNA